MTFRVAYPFITYRLRRVDLWRQARIRGICILAHGTGLFGVAWDELLPLVYFPPLRRPKLPRSLTQLRNPNSPSKRVILCCPWGRFARCFITGSNLRRIEAYSRHSSTPAHPPASDISIGTNFISDSNAIQISTTNT
ncbi:hypothetical protein M422DRAFT_248832 [Sphaerobolus stellatus SS14]|nr:hypothetical protein M422DRAFT_248832 [Sphaerobolus stellatus SS14]